MNNLLDIKSIGKAFYKIGEKAALNLWPNSWLPGVQPSQWMKIGIGLLVAASLWSLVQGLFLRADSELSAEKDELSGAPDELVTGADPTELVGADVTDVTGADPTDLTGAVDDLIVNPLSELLGDVTDTLQGIFLGAKAKAKATNKKDTKAANKAIANKAGAVANKAYQKPFVHRMVTNLILLYILTVILLQIGSLARTNDYFITSADFSPPTESGTSTSYSNYTKRYAPWRSDYSTYRKSY